ncbi:MAG TPA: group III truncated hemoglobin [Solirubrobacteraceae bacterium]|nr:group III truncated hemoglobin [Solirubrobacteraceae bacterium]
MSELPDIETRADCEALVRAFYGRAMTDPILGFIFTDVARLDLEAHVPKITAFWETILLGARSYSGGAFAVHAELNRKVRLFAGHFERWLWLWRMSVDERFAGERAELAKRHAERVAAAFYARLNGQEVPSAGAIEVPAGLVVTQHG